MVAPMFCLKFVRLCVEYAMRLGPGGFYRLVVGVDANPSAKELERLLRTQKPSWVKSLEAVQPGDDRGESAVDNDSNAGRPDRFHEMFTQLQEFPLLQRFLGLIVDLEFQFDDVLLPPAVCPVCPVPPVRFDLVVKLPDDSTPLRHDAVAAELETTRPDSETGWRRSF